MRFRSGGIDICSERDLPGMSHAPSGSPPAHVLHLVRGPTHPVPNEVPSGYLIADYEGPHSRLYCGVRHAEGFTLRFFGICDVDLTADLTRGRVSDDPGAPPGMAEVLLAGTTLAFVLAMLGRCVLHSSAVEVDGRALAFVGHSGMGKSTLTIASCLAGARLIAEDVVVTTTADPPACLPGNIEVRLREAAEPLLPSDSQWPRRHTADGRTSVSPPRTPLSEVPLDTIVIPQPRRSVDQLSVQTIPSNQAIFQLMRFPRVFGLTDQHAVRGQFEGLARIAASTRVLVVEIPWGPPFEPRLGNQLIDLLDRHQPAIKAQPTPATVSSLREPSARAAGEMRR